MSFVHLFFKFDGRIGRYTYILKGIGGLFVMSIPIFLVDILLFPETEDFGPIVFIWTIISYWMSWALSVKRAHDLNHSGWWLLWGFIPIIGWIYMAINLLGIKGTDGPNNYGIGPH